MNSYPYHERLTGLAISIVKSNNEARSKLRDYLSLRELCDLAGLAANAKEKEVLHRLIELVNTNSPAEIMETPIRQNVTSYGDKEARLAYTHGIIEKLIEPIDITLWLNIEKVKQIQKQQKQRRKVCLSILAIVALFIGAVSIYNLPIFEEMRLWNKIEKEHNIDDIKTYIYRFPDGEHYEDARFLELEYGEFAKYKYDEFKEEFPDSQYNERLNELYERYMYNQLDSSSSILAFYNFIELFPNGDYHDDVMSMYDKKWEEIIANYTEQNKDNKNKQTVAFMTELLEYLHHNHIGVVYLDAQIINNTKDFSDYSQKVRKFCEDYYRYSESKPIETHILSIKDSFSDSFMQSVRETLASELSLSLAQIAGDNIVKIRPVQDEDNINSLSPIISLSCTINNLEDYQYSIKTNIPSIWVETEISYPNYQINSQMGIQGGSFKQYLLGIKIDFKTSITFEGASNSFSHKDSGNLNVAYNNISRNRDKYEFLTDKCIADYTEKLVEKMGGQ